MRFAIVGAGAVGLYFGGRLAAGGHEVTFLARGKTLAALRREGLELTSPKGDLHLADVRAEERPEAIGEVDAVLLAVKAWQVPEVAPSLRPLVGPNTTLLPLQNGVEAPDQLLKHFPGRVLGGLCKIISEATAPAVVRHLGAEPTIALGELDGAASPRVADLASALDGAGIVAETPDDIRKAMWKKFLFIAPVSGIGAITRVPLGVFRQMAETRQLVRRSMEEVVAVARALGIALSDHTLEATLAFLDGLPPAGTASMQRDLMAGRPSELESQTGAVVRLAAQAGVEVPVNDFLYRCLLPSERAARRES
ncbi:MAG: 2-dehydropantoate 2-reductase [Acidobacteriota bacterium]